MRPNLLRVLQSLRPDPRAMLASSAHAGPMRSANWLTALLGGGLAGGGGLAAWLSSRGQGPDAQSQPQQPGRLSDILGSGGKPMLPPAQPPHGIAGGT